MKNQDFQKSKGEESRIIKYNRASPVTIKRFSVEDYKRVEEDTGLRFGSVSSPRAQKDRELWNKIEKNISPGEQFASYSAMCNAIGIKSARGGSSRQHQQERLKKFIDYVVNTDGTIKINKINYIPQDPKGIYLDSIQQALMLFPLYNQEFPIFDQNYIICVEEPRGLLYLLLGMRNPLFSSFQQQMYRFSKPSEQFTKYSRQAWADIFYTLNHKENQLIRGALESMQKRGLVFYVERVRYSDEYSTDLSESFETEKTRCVENEILKRDYGLNPNQKYMLFSKDNGTGSKWNEYQDKCREAMKRIFGWTHYFWVYQLFFYPSPELVQYYKTLPFQTPKSLYAQSLKITNQKLVDFFKSRDHDFFGVPFEDIIKAKEMVELVTSLQKYFDQEQIDIHEYIQQSLQL